MRWICIWIVSLASAALAADTIEKTVVFEAGTGGYAIYRIPGIVCTEKGTILAYCEARQARSDWGKIDIFLRRSTDGGITWEPRRQLAASPPHARKNPVALAQRLAKESDITLNNPIAIADGLLVHFLYCVEYNRCFYIRSDDEGATFSAPVEITSTFDQFKTHYPWQVLATGPGHGIVVTLPSGQSRLLATVWLSTGTGGHAHRPSAIATIFSDDRGKTWQAGQIIASDPNPKNPSESEAAQLADGRVMLNFRHESRGKGRGVVYSTDGISGWSTPAFDSALPEPVCMGSLLHIPDRNALLFSNPHNAETTERKNLTLKSSHDSGRSWTVSKIIEPSPSGYSDLAFHKQSGKVLCFYERLPGPSALVMARVATANSSAP